MEVYLYSVEIPAIINELLKVLRSSLMIEAKSSQKAALVC